MRIGIIACVGCLAGIGSGNPAAQSGSPATNTLSTCEKAEGFSLLFDGSLESFKGNFSDYQRNDSTNTNLSAGWTLNAADSSILSRSSQPDIRSRKRYGDFDLRFDYRNNGNQGIFYRTRVTGYDAWETGVEYAIDEFDGGTGTESAGAAFDLFKPRVDVYHRFNTGLWNHVRIIAAGDSVQHWLNGQLVVAFKYHSPDFWSAVDKGKWRGFPGFCVKIPGNRASGSIREGYLGFQGNHGGRWSLRNLRVSEKALFMDERWGCLVDGVKDPIGISHRNPRPPGGFLRRVPSGVSMEPAGIRPSSARLISLDGRRSATAFRIGPDGEAFFAGSFQSGLYFVELTTASGTSVRKMGIF